MPRYLASGIALAAASAAAAVAGAPCAGALGMVQNGRSVSVHSLAINAGPLLLMVPEAKLVGCPVLLPSAVS